MDWENLLREHGPAVWRTSFRLLANHADADECFQETFASALDWVRKNTQPVRQWRGLLIRLATARAVDRLRQRMTRSAREAPGADLDTFPDTRRFSRPDQRAEEAELSARLRAALAHLPSKQADAFCLHCLEGWSYREVAEHLETSTDDVGVLLHRARAGLRQRIASILSNQANLDIASRDNHPSLPSENEVKHEQ